MAVLGKSAFGPDNAGMNPSRPPFLHSDDPEHGFQFPGVFQLSAMGLAEAGLERELPALLERIGVTVRYEEVSVRASSAGRYVAVRLSFEARDRVEYDAAHQALRDHPDVKWTL